METFDFPNFTWTVRYPESSVKVKFGRGYEFASKPKGPDQVIYVLHFKAMKFFLTSGGNISIAKYPQINMQVLENFYNSMKMYEKFILPIPGKGDIVVRFAKPLEYKIMEGGAGLVEPFQLEFLSQP